MVISFQMEFQTSIMLFLDKLSSKTTLLVNWRREWISSTNFPVKTVKHYFIT